MNPAPVNNTTYAAPAGQAPMVGGGMTGAGATYPAAHDHTKRDTLLGAGAGAAGGHTVLGGLAGHAVGKHGEHEHQRAAAPAGAVGGTHPSMMNKIEGTVEAGVGKMTHNPAMVAQGQAKKVGGNVSATGTGAY